MIPPGLPLFYAMQIHNCKDGVLFCREDHSLVRFPNMLAVPADDEEEKAEALTYTVPAGTEIIL